MGKRTRGQQIFAVFNALLMVLIIITCLLPLINVLAVSFPGRRPWPPAR